MAQDRIYIRCSTCGEVRGLVGLSWAMLGSGPDAVYPITEGLVSWLTEHAGHHPRAKPEFGMTEFGPAKDWFTLETESERPV